MNAADDAMNDAKAAPGWYGKLPTLGDFASRRLEGSFIEPWDLWLGEGMAAHRETLGPGWLDAYLGSPVWRFVLLPGAMPAEPAALAGVLMPSVDKVGRYFPLTLVRRLDALPHSARELESLLGWLQRLEDIAVDAMHDDWEIEQLDAALEALPAPIEVAEPGAATASLAEALASEAGYVDLSSLRSRAELAALLCETLASAEGAVAQVAQGAAFWLADNPVDPQLLVSRGLPSRELFCRMLGASGREPGASTIF
jgi:type VI secretion system protein ImpM